MNTDRSVNLWMPMVMLLALVIIAGGVFILIGANSSPGIEIFLVKPQEIQGNLYISGAVNNPGIYPFYPSDTLSGLIRAAGGVKDGANLTDVELSIAPAGSANTTQKIDLNRAEAWLLEALPGIGEVKARAVIEYRNRNGFFHDVNELLNVPGFGVTGLAEIRDYVTIYD